MHFDYANKTATKTHTKKSCEQKTNLNYKSVWKVHVCVKSTINLPTQEVLVNQLLSRSVDIIRVFKEVEDLFAVDMTARSSSHENDTSP